MRMPTHQARAVQMSVPTGCWAYRSRMVLTMGATGWWSGEGAHRAGHGGGDDEGRADEGQEDERVGEPARAVDGGGGQAGDDRQPGQGQVNRTRMAATATIARGLL
jgi:hypothetical protein